MINSFYDETIEHLPKRINVRLVNNHKDFLKHTRRPTHITHKIFGKNYAVIHEIKPVLKVNKPIFVGFTSLKLSKCLMYDFHHNFIKKYFDAKLLFTDTYSLTYEIKSKNVYEEFFKHKHLFDFSNYPKASKFFDESNKKVIGKIKDVFEGKIIDEFVGLKSKMYSIKNIDGKETNTAKGVNIATEFNEFKDTLFNEKILRYKMKRIQAKNHKLGSYEISKISLSCFDDKKSVSNNGIDMFPYFHKDLRKKIKKSSHGKEEILTDKKDSKRVQMIKKILSDKKELKIPNRKIFKKIQKNSYKKKRFSQTRKI